MRYVVIVNFNSSAHLEACIKSLEGSEAVVVVVENGSPAVGEVERVRQITLATKSRLIVSPENRGFGSGVNLGVTSLEAQGEDLLWILNPDTVAEPEAFDALAKTIAKHPNSIVSPLITSGVHGDYVWFAGGELDTKRGNSRHTSRRPIADDPVECTFLTGAAIMMTATTWQALGGFREDLFLYWEDADLSIRAQAADIALFVVPTAVVWHKVGASSAAEGKSAIWYYYLARNRLLVCADGIGSAITIVLGPGILVTARLLVRALREREDRWRKLLAATRGTLGAIRTLARQQDLGSVRPS